MAKQYLLSTAVLQICCGSKGPNNQTHQASLYHLLHDISAKGKPYGFLAMILHKNFTFDAVILLMYVVGTIKALSAVLNHVNKQAI